MKITLVTSRPRERTRRTEFTSYEQALRFIEYNQPVRVDAVAVEHDTKRERIMERKHSSMPNAGGVNLRYAVATFIYVGLQAKWVKNSAGHQIIACRERDGDDWYIVDAEMFRNMELGHGVMRTFLSAIAKGKFTEVEN